MLKIQHQITITTSRIFGKGNDNSLAFLFEYFPLTGLAAIAMNIFSALLIEYLF